MISVLGVNISNETLDFFTLFNNFTDKNYITDPSTLHYDWRKTLIIKTFQSLCVDNNIEPLPEENFSIVNHTGMGVEGAWNSSKKTFTISYDDNMPQVNMIISTILHEFRHMWQEHNKTSLTDMKKDNLDGQFDSTYEEYYLQPIEVDAYDFEIEAAKFLCSYFSEHNINNRADEIVTQYLDVLDVKGSEKNDFRLLHDVNRFEDYIKTIDKDLKTIRMKKILDMIKNGYMTSNNFFKNAINFAKDTCVVDIENPEYLFKYEKYNIAATISGDKFNYCIYYPVELERNEYILDDTFSGKKYTMFFGNCNINACVSEFVFPPKNLDCQEFNNLLELNEELVKFYNRHFDKNIDKITFNPKFWNRSRNEYNSLFKKSKYKSNIFERLNGLPKGTFKLDLSVHSKLEDIILKTKDNNNFKPIISKIIDNRSDDISNLEFNMLRGRYSNIETTIDDVKHNFSELSNDDILKVFKRQIDNFSDINKILDDKNISNAIAEQIRFMNSSDLDTELKNKTSVVDRNNDIEIDEEKDR